MYFKQIAVEGLGCFSYAVGCPAAGVMAVVDPKRDIDEYLEISREEGMRITHILDTHVHADHVSGNQELRAATGAQICMYETTPVDFRFEKLAEGDILDLGMARMEVLHTPGHTPDSMSLVLTDRARGEEPWIILTGDLLFVGDIGRPDLAGGEALEAQVRNLYNSLYTKLGSYPDHLEVFPAHGMGSLCGRGMSSKKSTTLGIERRMNPMLRFPDFESFHAEMTQVFPTRPKSFTHIIATNKAGAPLLECCPLEKALGVDQFEDWMRQGAVVIDTRDTAAFGGYHIPGSLNIGFEKSLANWVGMVVPANADMLLVTDSREDFERMTVELHRIGYDAVMGYLSGGMAAWLNAGRPVDSLHQMSAGVLEGRLSETDAPLVLDVRTPGEVAQGVVPGSLHLALEAVIDGHTDDVPKDREVVVYCATGFRANIAASMLKNSGLANVHSLAGGFQAWSRSGRPVGQNVA